MSARVVLVRDKGETGKQPCISPGCGHASLPGIVSGQGRCAFHFAVYMWGLKWAGKCYPERAK